METIYQVNLLPIEPILFSDNRSARAGEDHLIRDQDPSPHTIFGAIGASLADAFGAQINQKLWTSEARQYLGEFVSDMKNGSTDRAELMGFFYSDTRGNLWFPRPLHIRLIQRDTDQPVMIGKCLRLAVHGHGTASSSSQDFESYLSCERNDDEADLDDYLSVNLLHDVLCGVELSGRILESERDRLQVAQIYKPETRLGVGMDNDANRPRRGLLFSRPYRRFASRVDSESGEWRTVGLTGFYKTMEKIPAPKLTGRRLAFLGGDRGRAIIQFVESPQPLENLRSAVKQAAAQSNGFFCYLLTPAVRESSWPSIAAQQPIAAAMGKEKVISGWNRDSSNQHPQPIRRLVPAGSIFFYQWPASTTQSAREDLINDYWLQPITKDAGGHFRNSGFGRILIGVWKNEN